MCFKIKNTLVLIFLESLGCVVTIMAAVKAANLGNSLSQAKVTYNTDSNENT